MGALKGKKGKIETTAEKQPWRTGKNIREPDQQTWTNERRN